MYKSSALKWVKNVKRNEGREWAYSEHSVGDFFDLNWSVSMRKNVQRAQVNELILIFQTLKQPKGTFLTHIVTPLNDITGYDEGTPKHPFTRKVCVIGKATPIDSIPKPQNLDFYRPNRGAVCHLNTIKDFQSKSDIDLLDLQSQIFNLFDTLDASLDKVVNFYNLEIDSIEEFEEGNAIEVLRRHKFYERSQEVVRKAKEVAKKENRLFCEVCKFDFESTYPSLGEGFIECHHTTPISSGGIRQTSIEDLALVCSNCHRMLHRKLGGKYLTVDELRTLLN